MGLPARPEFAPVNAVLAGDRCRDFPASGRVRSCPGGCPCRGGPAELGGASWHQSERLSMVLRRCALLVGILTLAAGCGGSGGGLALPAPTDRPPSVDPTGMPTDEPTEEPTGAPTT